MAGLDQYDTTLYTLQAFFEIDKIRRQKNSADAIVTYHITRVVFFG